jgi:transcriptional regulator with XRE-family HTH domain
MAATKETLAEGLVRLRQATGLSLRQVEEQTGIDRSILSRLENGEKRQPSPATLTKLASTLGVTPGELFTLAGYTSSEADVLPDIRPYLRTKYGHLTQTAQDDLAAFLERLESEEDTKRAGGQRSK